MNNDKYKPSLRERAEELIDLTGSPSVQDRLTATEDLNRLIHELEVHAVELEIQNAELKETRDQLEISHQRYYRLFDSAPVGYFTLDSNGGVVEVNQAGMEMLGLPRDRIIRRAFMTFVADQDLQSFILLLRRLRHGTRPERIALSIKSLPGENFDAQIEAANVTHNSNPELNSVHIILLDISEQKRLEQQRDMFFSIASHELRTPITNIHLSLELMLKEQAQRVPDDIREKLEIARRATQRLKNLTHDILELRMASRAELRMERLPVSMMPLIRETVSLNKPFAQQHGVEFRIQEPLPDVRVMGDEGRLVQVLNNLLTNAVKYSGVNGEVRIGMQCLGDRVQVHVSDDGIGIPHSLHEHIFKPFTQANPSLEDSIHKASFGLGLSIGRALIEKMGGLLDFDSIEGEGSKFFFELQIHPNDRA